MWTRRSSSILSLWSNFFCQLHDQEFILVARAAKIGLALNNLADSHALVGVTPAVAATPTVAYAQNPGDLLNLLPGRST